MQERMISRILHFICFLRVSILPCQCIFSRIESTEIGALLRILQIMHVSIFVVSERFVIFLLLSDKEMLVPTGLVPVLGSGGGHPDGHIVALGCLGALGPGETAAVHLVLGFEVVPLFTD